MTEILERILNDYSAASRTRHPIYTEKRLRQGLAALESMEIQEHERDLARKAIWMYFLGLYENPGKPLDGAMAIHNREEHLRESISNEVLALIQSGIEKSLPGTEAESAFRDSIHLHYSSKKIVKWIDDLKVARERAAGVKIDQLEWYKEQLRGIETYQYTTTYGKATMEPQKALNIVTIQKEIRKMEKEMDVALAKELSVDPEKLKSLKKKILKAEASPERGIETWFRTASGNLYTRRQIVDTKSNIMITMNAIIISVMLGSVYPQLKENPYLAWPITLMILTNVISIAYAIFATRPILANGIFTKEDIINKQARLSTFDDFYRVPLADYEWGIGEMLKDREFLYNTLIRDMHRLGVDLAARYKRIRLSYHVFLTGLIISLLSFASCYIFL
ncbi:MAG: DUF5706 domain-containing protein [Saprospiraceae bacterium]|nr:DUF5706 domain-containing protein [Saprospiraceae bacterium]